MANDDDIKELLKSLLASNNEIKEEIKQNRIALSTEIRELKEDLHTEIRELKGEIQVLEKEVSGLKERLRRVEGDAKKYKLMIYGLEEEEKGDLLQDIGNCIELFTQKLGLDCRFTDLRNVYRVGKPIDGHIRPVSIETSSIFLKNDILKHAKKLKGTSIFITPEYTKEDYEERKILRKYLKEAREKKQTAQIRNKKLLVEGREFSVEELKQLDPTSVHLPNNKTVESGATNKRKQAQTEIQEEGNPSKRTTRNQARDKNIQIV